MKTGRGFEIPTDLHYDGSRHLWVRREDADRVIIGMDAFGLDSLGELAYLSLADLGSKVGRGAPAGSFEAAKMTSSLEAPLSGTVVARNEAVLGDPQLVNRDPYGDGWLIAIATTNWDEESTELVSGTAIPSWVEDEERRLEEEDRSDG